MKTQEEWRDCAKIVCAGLVDVDDPLHPDTAEENIDLSLATLKLATSHPYAPVELRAQAERVILDCVWGAIARHTHQMLALCLGDDMVELVKEYYEKYD